MTVVMADNNLHRWLEELGEKYILIAPVTSDGITRFKPVRGPQVDSVDLKFLNTAVSPKGYFFPLSETMFSMDNKGGDVKPVSVDHEVVLFGIRPCDAAGIALIDKVFLAEPIDTSYKEKRDRTILIGLACNTPSPECFCTSLGGGPSNPMYLDILLTQTPSGYIVQAITGKGQELVSTVSLEEKDIPLPPSPNLAPIPVEGVSEMMRRNFDSPYWDRVADRCIHCNICSYVCPCCYCFDIRDYTGKDRIDRVRSWESCQSAGFTKIAGGHDPRPTKGARLRQRWFHKLLYYPTLFGEIKCTGCGRCVRSCPVNIDIREIIMDVQKLNV
ncbi:MAG: 4Fe-4S dicluster domain-containing protein [Dehalococcoidia bacterium]|jgi:ferredoxin